MNLPPITYTLPAGCKISILDTYRIRINGKARKMARGQCNVCGTIKEFILNSLVSGDTKSCCGGKLTQLKPTHGLSSHPLRAVYTAMIRRCNSSTGHNVNAYYNKGITVCDEWKDFLTFYNWAISNGYRKGLEIDRRENSKGYFPGNCRWVTNIVNARNKDTNRPLTYNGETRLMIEWAPIVGLPYKRIHARLARGWSVEKTLSTPLNATR